MLLDIKNVNVFNNKNNGGIKILIQWEDFNASGIYTLKLDENGKWVGSDSLMHNNKYFLNELLSKIADKIELKD